MNLEPANFKPDSIAHFSATGKSHTLAGSCDGRGGTSRGLPPQSTAATDRSGHGQAAADIGSGARSTPSREPRLAIAAGAADRPSRQPRAGSRSTTQARGAGHPSATVAPVGHAPTPVADAHDAEQGAAATFATERSSDPNRGSAGANGPVLASDLMAELVLLRRSIADLASAVASLKTAPPAAALPDVITVADVAAMLGRSYSAALQLVKRLEADGLRRKGLGHSTCYDRAEFLARWRAKDDRQ